MASAAVGKAMKLVRIGARPTSKHSGSSQRSAGAFAEAAVAAKSASNSSLFIFRWFGGGKCCVGTKIIKKEYLKAITDEVSIPVLRKDFTVDEYQIYEAKTLGAGVVLLICALLDTETIRSYIEICDRLGLSALVEVHDENEMDSAIKAGARVIGVNNRNLKDFTVDISNSTRLRSLAPENALFVAESGIKTAKDIQVLKDASVNGVLIGETLMRSPDKAAMLAALNGGAL